VSATTLLDELRAAGIWLNRDGDDLSYRTRPGVSIAPHREQITTHKPALVTELRLREAIVAAASAVHARFDRERYDELWRRWSELQAEEIT
jgi:hypothetical protein